MIALALYLLAGDFRLPEGFEISQLADHTHINDTHCMTVSPRGEIFVSGRGYLRRLDVTKEGTKATDFTAAPKDGAMGLFADGTDLYAVGDGGVKVWRGADPRKPPATLLKIRTGGEHAAHALTRGPDGWFYLMVGDNTGITRDFINSADSLVRDPVGGCVLRLSPDWKQRQVFAHGFRNAYAMDFGPEGALYTFDSDNERCLSLPWYEGCRCYRIEPGGHHGWCGPLHAATWRMPPYFLDVVPPLATLGRGSPTGVVVYKHASFPARYQGGVFLADWTFGRIYFVTRAGKVETFLRSSGSVGFAPTALAVHPETGDLLVSIGGRGTRGGLYRIRYPAGVKHLDRNLIKRLQPRQLWLPRGEANSPDRLQRQRAARVWPADANQPESLLARSTYYLARPSAEAIELLRDARLSIDLQLDGVRLVQRWLGGPPDPKQRGTLWEGYSCSRTAGIPRAVREVLRQRFPSKKDTLDRELARTLAMLQDDDPAVARAVVAQLGGDPTDDFHYLAVLARLRAPWEKEYVPAVVTSLLTLEQRLQANKRTVDSNWPLRLAELHAALAQKAPALNAALLADKRFGRAEHVVFTRAAGVDRVAALERFLAQPERPWNAQWVGLLQNLPAERALPLIRELWGQAGLEEELMPLLARHATADDRPKLLSGLTSARLATVQVVLAALDRLPPDSSETLPLLRGLAQLPADKETAKLRERVMKRLQQVTKHHEKSVDAWIHWARQRFPDQAAALANLDGVDEVAWKRRLKRIDWSKGDAQRGAVVFAQARCATCHSGAAALGPDLVGVSKRFSRDDLLTAIIQPSKDVSPRYRTTRLVTERGTVHQGIILYDAPGSVIVQTGPAETLRLSGKLERSPSPRSLMPAGLLDPLSDQQIADLLQYLTGL